MPVNPVPDAPVAERATAIVRSNRWIAATAVVTIALAIAAGADAAAGCVVGAAVAYFAARAR